MTPRRVLLKLSGEALEGEGESALHPETLDRVAQEIAGVTALGHQLGVVIGGGNFFRGAAGAAKGMNRSAGDAMGMLATVMNCVAMHDAFSRRAALAGFDAGQVVLLAGGTGNPYFTTDSAAALRALEIDAEVLLKATKVDGIYDKDPVGHEDAKRFAEITYDEVLERRLAVMDLTAITLCRDHSLPLVVFDMEKSGNIARAVAGEDVGTRVHA